MQVLTQYLGGQIDDETSSIIVSNLPDTVRPLSTILRGFAALFFSTYNAIKPTNRLQTFLRLHILIIVLKYHTVSRSTPWSIDSPLRIGQILPGLTLWRRNYFFFNFSTSCIKKVNNTGTKQVSIMKQTAF